MHHSHRNSFFRCWFDGGRSRCTQAYLLVRSPGNLTSSSSNSRGVMRATLPLCEHFSRYCKRTDRLYVRSASAHRVSNGQVDQGHGAAVSVATSANRIRRWWLLHCREQVGQSVFLAIANPAIDRLLALHSYRARRWIVKRAGHMVEYKASKFPDLFSFSPALCMDHQQIPQILLAFPPRSAMTVYITLAGYQPVQLLLHYAGLWASPWHKKSRHGIHEKLQSTWSMESAVAESTPRNIVALKKAAKATSSTGSITPFWSTDPDPGPWVRYKYAAAVPTNSKMNLVNKTANISRERLYYRCKSG